MVGSIYVAVWGWIVFAYWGLGWRVLAAICAFPALCAFFLVLRFVPESPRFLALQGQYEAALYSTRQLAVSMNYRGEMLTKAELLHYYPLSDVTSAPSASLVQACREFGESARLLYVVPELLPTTANLQVIWFALSFGSYGLTTWINLLFEQVHLQNVYTNALLFALANLPGNVISAFLMDRGSSGRSRLLTGSLLAAATSLVAFAAAATRPEPSRLWIVGSACTFQACTISAWNAVDVLSSELFPTQVRATGMGMCAASGRFGAMLAQTVNGFLVGSPARLLLVAATTLLVGAVSPTFLPDATGRPVADRVDGGRRTVAEADGNLSLHAGSAFKSHSYQRVDTGGEAV
jgi:Sugar (and other) transporter